MFITSTSYIAMFAVAALFGGMVFFPVVVAPIIFRALEPAAAGGFLRNLFPAYYLYVAATAAIGAFAALPHGLPESAALMAVAVSTLLVRQFLAPRINAWRDAELAGDRFAGEKFAAAHRLSVVINLCQLLAAAWTFWALISLAPRD